MTFDSDDDEPRARVLVASHDPRFLRLARFLLGGRDFEVEELTSPERLPEAVLEPSVDIAVLDGGDTVADALRTANATRARRPEVPMIIAADTGGKSPPACACSIAGTRPKSFSRTWNAFSQSASREPCRRFGVEPMRGDRMQRRTVALETEPTKLRL